MDFIKILWFFVCIVLSLLLSTIVETNTKYTGGNISNEYYGSGLTEEIHDHAIALLNDTDSIVGGNDNDSIVGGNDTDSIVGGNDTDRDPCNKDNYSVYASIKKCVSSNTEYLKNYKPNHVWYKHKTWKSLFSNENDTNKYFNDINVAYLKFYFNWNKVFNEIVPYVKNEIKEAIGVIKCEKDGKTLYIEEMEVCNHSRKIKPNSTYVASIHESLVTKYLNKPAYFAFHTHPSKGSDPWPSDNDIEILLEYNYHGKYLGHIVFSVYGAIIYFLNRDLIEDLKKKGKLVFYTFCYDLLSAWNSFTFSAYDIRNDDLINVMSKFGLNIIVIPSPAYISDNYRLNRIGSILVGRFIHDKDKLLNTLKSKIKELERKEEK